MTKQLRVKRRESRICHGEASLRLFRRHSRPDRTVAALSASQNRQQESLRPASYSIATVKPRASSWAESSSSMASNAVAPVSTSEARRPKHRPCSSSSFSAAIGLRSICQSFPICTYSLTRSATSSSDRQPYSTREREETQSVCHGRVLQAHARTCHRTVSRPLGDFELHALLSLRFLSFPQHLCLCTARQ
jgi:hypothetical protein